MSLATNLQLCQAFANLQELQETELERQAVI